MKDKCLEDVVIPIETIRELDKEKREIGERFSQALDGSKLLPSEKRTPTIADDKDDE